MLAWLGSAFVAHRLALAQRKRPWSIAATPAWFNLPVMLLIAFDGMTQLNHVFQSWGWLVVAPWCCTADAAPPDAGAPRAWWSWTTWRFWLLVLLGGNVLIWATTSTAATTPGPR
jgi:hypothetical protein